MKKNNSSNQIWLFLVICILLVAVTFYITKSFFTGEETTDAFKKEYKITVNTFVRDYAIALNNIHAAIEDFDFASINHQNANNYVVMENYTYYDATNLLSTAKTFGLDGKELLLKAETKLQGIQGKEPSQFFVQDVQDRVQQVRLLIEVTDLELIQIELSEKQLYEINYGSEVKANDYLNQYNNNIPSYNTKLGALSAIQNKIDRNWDQDWYPEFEGSRQLSPR